MKTNVKITKFKKKQLSELRSRKNIQSGKCLPVFSLFTSISVKMLFGFIHTVLQHLHYADNYVHQLDYDDI